MSLCLVSDHALHLSSWNVLKKSTWSWSVHTCWECAKVISVDICDRSLTITGLHSSPSQERAHLSFGQVAIISKGDNSENLELLMASELYEVWNRETSWLVQCFLLCLFLALFLRKLAKYLCGTTEPGNFFLTSPSQGLPRPQSLPRIGAEVRRHYRTFNMQCHHVSDRQSVKNSSLEVEDSQTLNSWMMDLFILWFAIILLSQLQTA